MFVCKFIFIESMWERNLLSVRVWRAIIELFVRTRHCLGRRWAIWRDSKKQMKLKRQDVRLLRRSKPTTIEEGGGYQHFLLKTIVVQSSNRQGGKSGRSGNHKERGGGLSASSDVISRKRRSLQTNVSSRTYGHMLDDDIIAVVSRVGLGVCRLNKCLSGCLRICKCFPRQSCFFLCLHPMMWSHIIINRITICIRFGLFNKLLFLVTIQKNMPSSVVEIEPWVILLAGDELKVLSLDTRFWCYFMPTLRSATTTATNISSSQFYSVGIIPVLLGCPARSSLLHASSALSKTYILVICGSIAVLRNEMDRYFQLLMYRFSRNLLVLVVVVLYFDWWRRNKSLLSLFFQLES